MALLHRKLAIPLQDYLAGGGRRVMHFLQQSGGHAVLFQKAGEAFDNMNRAEDLHAEEH